MRGAHATGSIFNLIGMRRLALIRSGNRVEDGLACLAMIAGWYGYRTDMANMRRHFPDHLNSPPPEDLVEPAAALGLQARVLQCKAVSIQQLRLPCILHWNRRRYVVLEKVRGNTFWLVDPLFGRRQVNRQQLDSRFDDRAIEVAPTEGFTKKVEKTPFKMTDLLRITREARSALSQGVILSLFMQLLALLTPFFMQIVIDNIISSSDLGLLGILALAFGLLATFNAIASALRGLTFQLLINAVSFDASDRLYNQLSRLPLRFFERRPLGDVFSKFRAVDPITQFLSANLAVFIDAALGMVTCVLMLTYSVGLGLLVTALTAIYFCLRWRMNRFSTQAFAERAELDAREGSQVIESLRAMQTIKVLDGAASRGAQWRELYVQKVNAAFKYGNVTIGFQALSLLISGLGDVLVTFLAARAVIAGDMTVGVITAFIAYKAQFTTRIIAVADQFSQYRVFDAQLARLADIALSEPEERYPSTGLPCAPLDGEITISDLRFRYAPNTRAVVESLSVRIEPGQFVAITGPSGEGKTTLLKLLLGLYPPESGEIWIDGVPMSKAGPQIFRRFVGAVMQEDIILSGTVAENIALFCDEPDMQKLRRAAVLAQLDAEIMSFPQQYLTILGDGGRVLSSGQRQRLLIARAIYRAPKFILMDEGTANLDQACEARVIEALRSLNTTCIMVAHSQAVVRAADRVLRFSEGRLYEVVRSPEPVQAGAATGTSS